MHEEHHIRVVVAHRLESLVASLNVWRGLNCNVCGVDRRTLPLPKGRLRRDYLVVSFASHVAFFEAATHAERRLQHFGQHVCKTEDTACTRDSVPLFP